VAFLAYGTFLPEINSSFMATAWLSGFSFYAKVVAFLGYKISINCRKWSFVVITATLALKAT
jgi:hypothetical protein